MKEKFHKGGGGSSCFHTFFFLKTQNGSFLSTDKFQKKTINIVKYVIFVSKNIKYGIFAGVTKSTL